MKNVLAVALVLVLMGLAGTASAQTKVRSWDDLEWWAQSGATAESVQDSSRSGYWWWPTEPASNADDQELWGNRGVVYAQKPAPPPPLPPPSPPEPPTPPPTPTRTVPVLNHILFNFDKSVLKAEGKAEVDKAVRLMKTNPGDTVVIEGHTCSVGEADYNMGLGERRAKAVKKYMVDNGIAERRVTAVSKGETDPAVSNDTPASRKNNRRAVFKYSIGD